MAGRAFPSCCIHCLGGGEVWGEDAAKRGWGGSAAGRPQLPRLCPRGWAPRARRAGGGRQRRARAGGAAGARGGRGCERRGPPRAGPGEERAPGWAQRRVPSRRGRPAAPSRTMATDSKCALGRGGPGWAAAGPRGGKFSSLDTCPYAGLADQHLGPHRPRRTLGPLPITLRYQAGLQRRRWSWKPSGGMWQKGVRRTEMVGTLRCGGAEGQRGLPFSPLGAVPSGPGPGFGEPCHQGTTSPWRCEFKVRLEFWVGFAVLPLGIRVPGCWAALWPHLGHATKGSCLVTVGSECD